MDTSGRRASIRTKLARSILPYNSIERLCGGPAKGEMCNGCDEVVPQGTLVMEGASAEGPGVQFHVECFYIWDQERRFPRMP